MAMTVSLSFRSDLPGGSVLIAGTATGSANYQTSEAMDLSTWFAAGSSPIVVMSGGGGYIPQHDRGNAAAGALHFYEAGADSAALDEVAASTDLSATIITFMAMGPVLL